MSIEIPMTCSPIPLSITAYICLIPMALSLAHDHWAHTMRFLRMLFLLISVIPLRSIHSGCLEHMECFAGFTHRIPELTQIFLQNLLFLGKIFTFKELSLWSMIRHTHDFDHHSFSEVPSEDRQHLLLTGLFYFAKMTPFNLRKKIHSIFFRK